jgi:hypothetical protein
MVKNEIASIKAESQDDESSLPIIDTKIVSLKNLVEKTSGVIIATTGLADVF